MAYQVIARKWRPQTFADLVGQEHVTNTLANAIKNDRVAHAYIFSGARGVGKTTAARILAKAMNCVNGPTAEPCGVCAACTEIAAGNSLDVIEIDAASNRGIDQIRELREMVRYAPASSRSKVVILDEAHMLTGEASNALLKTLEEPPDRVVFVMATTEPEELVDTIRSRSQHFHFRALTFNEISDRLRYIAEKESLTIDDGALSVIARMAEGSMRDALSLLEQARAYCGDAIHDKDVRELLGVVPEDALNELVQSIAEQSAERALALVHTFQKEGRNLQHFCREAIRHVRNLLIARVCGADSDLIAATPEQRPGLAKAAALFSEEDLTRFFQILLQTDDDLRGKPDPRVHLEMGLLRLVNAARLAPLEALLAEARGGTSATAGTASSGSSSGSGGSSGGAASRNSTATGTTGSFFSRTTSASAAVTNSFAVAAEKPAAATTSSPSAWGSGSAAAAVSPARSVEPEKTFASGNASQLTEEKFPTTVSAAPAKMSVPSTVEKPATMRSQATPTASEGAAAGNSSGQSGLSVEKIAEIKTAIQAQQKFIGELIEHASRWELEGSELRIYFPPEKSTFSGLIEGRETIEKIRIVSSNVLGRAVRVCARLDSSAANGGNVSRTSANGAPGIQEMRAQFENDPIVKSMLQRFGGRISEVRRQED